MSNVIAGWQSAHDAMIKERAAERQR